MMQTALTLSLSPRRYASHGKPASFFGTNSARVKKPKAKAAPKKAPTKPAAKKTTQTKLNVKPAVKSAAAKKKAQVDSGDELSEPQISDNDSLSHTPPKSKKTTAPKRAGSKPLADVENESHGGQASAGGDGANTSDKYQKVGSSSRKKQTDY